MTDKLSSFFRDAPVGLEKRASVAFVCEVCKKEYSTVAGAMVCHSSATAMEIESMVERFQSRAWVVEYPFTVVISSESGTTITEQTQGGLEHALEHNIDWILPANHGKLSWNVLEYSTIVLLGCVSTVFSFLMAFNQKAYVWVVYALALAWYTYSLGKNREVGILSDPVPIVPFRISVVLLILSVVFFIAGGVVHTLMR